MINLKAPKRVVFVSTLSELHDYISPAELKLPKATLAFEKEVTSIFSPVIRVISLRLQVPVIMKVSQDYVQFTSVCSLH